MADVAEADAVVFLLDELDHLEQVVRPLRSLVNRHADLELLLIHPLPRALQQVLLLLVQGFYFI